MKIWEKVIARRMREESEVSQKQFGFMPGRGTTETIFAIQKSTFWCLWISKRHTTGYLVKLCGGQ
jgi:hypothetical protein